MTHACPHCHAPIAIPDVPPSLNEFGEAWLDRVHFAKPMFRQLGVFTLAIFCTHMQQCECVAIPYGRCIVRGPHTTHCNDEGACWMG